MNMRHSIQIVEAWHATVRSLGFRDSVADTDLHRNPSRAEFMKLLKQHEHGLRGFLMHQSAEHGGGDLYVWDAYVATHGDMEQQTEAPLTNTSGATPIFYADHVLLTDINMYSDDPDGWRYRVILRRICENFWNNPNVTRLYGGPPRVVGHDFEVGENVEITPVFLMANVAPERNRPR